MSLAGINRQDKGNVQAWDPGPEIQDGTFRLWEDSGSLSICIMEIALPSCILTEALFSSNPKEPREQ